MIRKTHNIYQKQNKLNDFLKTTDTYQSVHSDIKINRSKKCRNTAQSPIRKQHFSSSFYDNFQFVDRLTNNKMTYKDARKNSNSFTTFKKSAEINQKSHLSSLLSIYKKTKDFEMKSLRQKIFRKKQQNSIQNQKTPKQSRKYIQSTIQSQQQGPRNDIQDSPFILQSKKKNKVRSFVDKTINQINKAELKRIIKQDDCNIKSQVVQINQQRNNIKANINQQKINDLLYFRQKQEFQLGNTDNYIKKDDLIIFKDLTKFEKNKAKLPLKQEKSQITNNVLKNCFSIQKNNKLNNDKMKDIFIQKMLTHARNQLKKQGQYLIVPTKQKQTENMLVKKGKKKYLLSAYKNNAVMSENSFDFSQFSFQKKEQSQLLKQVKYSLQKYKRTVTQTVQNSHTIQNNKISDLQQAAWKFQKKRDIFYLLKNNFVANVSIQLSTNVQNWNKKDQKDNNLLHLAIKNENHQILELIFKKVSYKVCRQLLQQKNSNKRTPKQLAILLFDGKALQIIQSYQEKNVQKQILRSYLTKEQNYQIERQ